MERGPTPYFARRSRILRASSALICAGLHILGLEENIWKVLAAASAARCTAVQQPPAVPTWTPIRLAALVIVCSPILFRTYRERARSFGITSLAKSLTQRNARMPESQNYSNHVRFDPLWQYFIAPAFLLCFISGGFSSPSSPYVR